MDSKDNVESILTLSPVGSIHPPRANWNIQGINLFKPNSLYTYPYETA